jgi:phosphate transport system protein
MEHRHLHAQLADIRDRLLGMGETVESMIADATRALVARDTALAEAVLERDVVVDRQEVAIDEACHSVLARNQPTAVDMRFLVAAMKITADLERMGDSAVNIAQSARRLNEQSPLAQGIDFAAMSQGVQAMVRNALAAFVARDAATAAAVCRADDAVDDAYHEAFEALLALMTREPETVTRAIHLLLAARNLERIADHATNVAEDVIYYVDGRDVRHSLSPPPGR